MIISCNQTGTRRGFTLIELLVVMAIIGVIAAILLPVFATVRERGRSATCQNNLRQLALAMAQYVQDNDGRYPLFTPHLPTAGWQASILPYLKTAQVFHCPDRPAEVYDSFTGMARPLTSVSEDYLFNWTRLNTFVPPYPTKIVFGTHEARLTTPSTIWLNVDSSWSDPDGTFHYSRVAKSTCGRLFVGSTLHSGGGNYSFVDSHVKWLTPEQAGGLECQNGPLPAP